MNPSIIDLLLEEIRYYVAAEKWGWVYAALRDSARIWAKPQNRELLPAEAQTILDTVWR